MHTAIPLSPPSRQAPWNKGRLTGQKRPLKPKHVWAIRVRVNRLRAGGRRIRALGPSSEELSPHLEPVALTPGSHWTPRWREADSNCRSLIGPGLRLAS